MVVVLFVSLCWNFLICFDPKNNPVDSLSIFSLLRLEKYRSATMSNACLQVTEGYKYGLETIQAQ